MEDKAKHMRKLDEHTASSEKEKSLLARCREEVLKVEPFAEVILYGSRARGDASQLSDYDLLIITDRDATLEREDQFRRQMYFIELETGAVITVILVDRQDWDSALYQAMPFYQNIRKEGILL
jgi:predicted nucleotidyltransferase